MGTWLATFLRRRWFLVVLAVVLGVGISLPGPLAPLAQHFPHRLIVATVLFLMSWPLDATAMGKALARPLAVLLGVGVNALLVPLVAWGVGLLLEDNLALGLMIAAAIPCTLVSAAVWSRRAGGNDAVALLVMMITNLGCFVVTPFWLWLAAGKVARLDVSFSMMVLELMVFVVLPILAGQAARWPPAAARWASAHTAPLGLVAQAGILAMVLLGAIRSGQQIAQQPAAELAIGHVGPMLAAVLGVHLSTLAAGHVLGIACRLDRFDRIAVGFAGSQKTLMVGLHLGVTLGAPIIPVVAYHVCQLLADTLVADWLRSREGPQAKTVAEH